MKAIASYVIYGFMQPTRRGSFADAAACFICGIINIFLLLAVIVSDASVIRGYFSPERTNRLSSDKDAFMLNIWDSLPGMVIVSVPAPPGVSSTLPYD